MAGLAPKLSSTWKSAYGRFRERAKRPGTLMRRREPLRTGSAVALAALAAVSFIAASGLAPHASAQTSTFHGLAGANKAVFIEFRRRFRHHRRSHFSRVKREELAQARPAELESQSSAQNPQPPAGQTSMEPANEPMGKPAGAAPKLMGPPPPPERWTAAEVEAGRMECARLLSGLHALFEPLEPIKEGACGTPAPIRLLYRRAGSLTREDSQGGRIVIPC